MTARTEQLRETSSMVDFDIGRPHKIMTWLEYVDCGFRGPHIVEHMQDGTNNVAYWPIDPVLAVEFDRGKGVGKMIGWQQAKEDSSKVIDAVLEGKRNIEVRDGRIQALESRDDEIKRLNMALADARHRLKGAGMLGSDESL